MDYWIIWFVAALVFALLEIATSGFFIIIFGVGAVVAGLSSIFISNLTIQLIIFIVSTTIAFIFLKPFINKHLLNQKRTLTNVDRVINKKGIVIKAITTDMGQVKVDGEVWSAVSKSGEEIKENEKVIVEEVSGVKLVVSKIEE